MDIYNPTRSSGDFDAVRIEMDGSAIKYVGMASPYTQEADSGWVIKLLEYSGGNLTSVKYAYATDMKMDGFIWANRASYTYR